MKLTIDLPPEEALILERLRGELSESDFIFLVLRMLDSGAVSGVPTDTSNADELLGQKN